MMRSGVKRQRRDAADQMTQLIQGIKLILGTTADSMDIAIKD
jgi:hypothetical protein